MRQKGDAMRQAFDPSSLGNSLNCLIFFFHYVVTILKLELIITLLSPIGPSKIPSIKIPGKLGNGTWEALSGSDSYHASSDASLFSSSLPVLPHEKCMCLFSQLLCHLYAPFLLHFY